MWNLRGYIIESRKGGGTYEIPLLPSFPSPPYPSCFCLLTTFCKVLGSHDSTSYHGNTRPFPFPQPGHITTRIRHNTTRIDGSQPCHFRDCRRCAASPEVAPIHYDCYIIFTKKCSVEGIDALCRLWILAAWRKPWRGAQPINLPRAEIDKDVLRTTARFCGFPLLYKLPAELVEAIRGYSRHCLLWRCISALQLASHVSNTGPEPLLTVPLSEIRSWERNGKLERVISPPGPFTIRLTIDSDGVERLSRTPQYSGECYKHSVFIVERDTYISGVAAQLKVTYKLSLS